MKVHFAEVCEFSPICGAKIDKLNITNLLPLTTCEKCKTIIDNNIVDVLHNVKIRLDPHKWDISSRLLNDRFWCHTLQYRLKSYHATNRISANRMMYSQIGMNYKACAKEICIKFGIYKNAVEKAFELWKQNEDASRNEFHGGVSFFPTFEQAARIASQYAANCGEWKGSFLNYVVDCQAEIQGTPIDSNGMVHFRRQVLNEFGGADSSPVVVVVGVQLKDIENIDDVGKGCELYTSRSIPSHNILAIRGVVPHA